jgi:hypothetical protein
MSGHRVLANMRTTPDPNETLDQIRTRWALEVGRLLLAFGDIEWVTLECLRTLPREPLFESLATLPLARRIALLRSILSSRPNLGEAGQRLLRLLTRAGELSKTRNLIAHNPLGFIFYHGESTGRSHMFDQISTSKSPNHTLSFDEISSAAKDAEALSSALSEAFYDIPGFLRRG